MTMTIVTPLGQLAENAVPVTSTDTNIHRFTYVLAFDEVRDLWRLSFQGAIVPLNILSQDHEERFIKLGQVRSREAKPLAIHVARTMLEHTYQSFGQGSCLVVLDADGEVEYTTTVPLH